LRKSRFSAFGDKQTDEQMDSIDTLSRSRCRERRLNKIVTCSEMGISPVGYFYKDNHTFVVRTQAH